MERIDLAPELKERMMKLMTIGNVSKQSGIGVETVRFYEKSGLIDEPPRTESGYRQYPASTVVRIRFIRRAKELGFTLKEIKGLLNLRLDPTTTCDEVRLLAEEKLTNVRAKVQSLQGIEEALGKLIGACARGGPDGECPFLEALGSDWQDSAREESRQESNLRQRESDFRTRRIARAVFWTAAGALVVSVSYLKVVTWFAG